MVKKYEVILFEIGRRKPIEEFISTLSEKTVSKILWMIDLLEVYGVKVGMPYVKWIKKDLFELRIRKQEQIRFLITEKNNRIYILHGFKKKKRKIPAKEILIVESRLTFI